MWGGWGAKDPLHTNTNILSKRPKTGFWVFVFGYPIFMLACFFFALKRLRAGDTLVCVDLETLMFGMWAARLRGAHVHFDIADPFDLAKPVPIKKFWRWLESRYASWADVVTVPHVSRLSLYKRPLNRAYVVENVPTLPAGQKKHNFLETADGCKVMTFGYFGTLETHRGLEDLVTLVRTNPETQLIIGGRGSLAQQMVDSASSCDRIRFVGEYSPENLPDLAADVDVYCSLYYLSKPLHRYAAPNKFFEHLALGKPVLMSAGTPYAQDVLNNGTGWIVEDGLMHLQDWYDKMKFDRSAFESAAFRASKKWTENYIGWLDTQREYFFSRS